MRKEIVNHIGLLLIDFLNYIKTTVRPYSGFFMPNFSYYLLPIFVDWSKPSVYYLLEIIISQYRV